MEANVTIKGTKSGIILVLDPSVPFTDLRQKIAEKFTQASSFLGKHDMGLILRGRFLSDNEIDEIVGIIEDNSDLHIICIIDEQSEKEELIRLGVLRHNGELQDVQKTPLESDISDGDAVIYKGNLRSGQDFKSDKSIIVLGDVKPGGNVVSKGSIFILGELRGNAFAGCEGDNDSVIMALKLAPIQVRIGDAIAISPDAEKGARIKSRKKFLGNDKMAEVAYIENGHIVKTSYDASFLRRFYSI
ncbi:MAG: septum site-determining protein MinC [Butyrivibrio sp.]|nr:septum site-determining protein MinC [Butyrivibrio sp.]